MEKGSAPIQMLKKGLGEAAWKEKEVKLPKLPAKLSSDAWLGMGVK